MKVRNARAVSVDCGAARNLCISTGYVFAKHCANASSLSIAAGDGSTNCTAASVGATAIIPRPIAMKEEVAPTSSRRTNVPARIVLRSSNRATSASTSGLLYGRVGSAKTKFFTAPTNVEESEGKVDPQVDAATVGDAFQLRTFVQLRAKSTKTARLRQPPGSSYVYLQMTHVGCIAGITTPPGYVESGGSNAQSATSFSGHPSVPRRSASRRRPAER